MNRRTLFGLLCLWMCAFTGFAQSQLASQMLQLDPRDKAQAVAESASMAAHDEAIRNAVETLGLQPVAKPNEAEAKQVAAEADEPELIDGVCLQEWTGGAFARRAPQAAPKRVRMAEDATYFEFDYNRKDGVRNFKGMPRIVLTSDTTAVMYKLWNLADTLQVKVDQDAGKIEITPTCVYVHSTYGEIWAASMTDSYYSLSEPITGTINENGDILLDGWCLVIIAGDYKGYGYGFYSKSELKMPNASMENVYYDGSDVENTDSVYTYPVYIEQTYDNMLAVAAFTNYPKITNLRLSSDSVVTIPPQLVFTNLFYGNFLINPASWATSKAAQKGNLISTNVTPTEIDFGNWGVFCAANTSLRTTGVLSSRLIFNEGCSLIPRRRIWIGPVRVPRLRLTSSPTPTSCRPSARP